MKLFKKGQGGGDAAVLLIVVTILLVLYLLIIPPEARLALLGDENNTMNGSDDPANNMGEVILSEQIGELEFISRLDRNINLQPFRIQSQTSGQIIATRNSLQARNSAFETQDASMTFSLDPSNTENLVFTAQVERGLGVITVTLNEEIVLYQGEVINGNLPNIFIEAQDLRNENRITISVSNPGIAFWRVNQYVLENIQVSADVTDVTQTMNTQAFSLNQNEIQNFREARIRYLPSCVSSRQIRGYEVYLNNQLIFQGTPDCEIYNEVTVTANQLRVGNNVLEFNLERGEVLIDLLEIRTQLEEPNRPLLYFNLPETDFTFSNETQEFMLEENSVVELELNFPSPGERRRVEVFVNGQIVGFSTTNSQATQNISAFVRPQTNSLEVRPQQTLTITDLRVLRR